MRALLGVVIIWAAACSSNGERGGDIAGASGQPPLPGGGEMSVSSAGTEQQQAAPGGLGGGSIAGSAAEPGGSDASGAEPAGGEGGAPVSIGGAGGSLSASSGVAGSAGVPSAGMSGGGDAGATGVGGVGGAVGTSGSGGSAAGGATAGSGGASAGTSGSSGLGGVSGSSSQPDPCEGVKHWSASETWPSYKTDEKRVFGGKLWTCPNPLACYSYPGFAVGWLEVATCTGGPIAEKAPCQCTAGACCDGCYLRASSYRCDIYVQRAQCSGDPVASCGSGTSYIYRDQANVFCTADSPDCTGTRRGTVLPVGASCPANTGCIEHGDIDTCDPCQ